MSWIDARLGPLGGKRVLGGFGQPEVHIKCHGGAGRGGPVQRLRRNLRSASNTMVDTSLVVAANQSAPNVGLSCLNGVRVRHPSPDIQGRVKIHGVLAESEWLVDSGCGHKLHGS